MKGSKEYMRQFWKQAGAFALSAAVFFSTLGMVPVSAAELDGSGTALAGGEGSAQIELEAGAAASAASAGSEPAAAAPETSAAEDMEGQAAEPEAPWYLTLVNPWNPVPEGYQVTLKRLSGINAVDERCDPDLQQMLRDCRKAGYSPVICSSYRTQEKQVYLYNNKVLRLMNQGYTRDGALAEAARAVARPGTSEHQLGLALDIVDYSYQQLDSLQENTATQKWLMEHSWEYGFILRYPEDKSEITGIIYEPWHYRYVGIEAAKEMHETGLCLEEYLLRRQAALAPTVDAGAEEGAAAGESTAANESTAETLPAADGAEEPAGELVDIQDTRLPIEHQAKI